MSRSPERFLHNLERGRRVCWGVIGRVNLKITSIYVCVAVKGDARRRNSYDNL